MGVFQVKGWINWTFVKSLVCSPPECQTSMGSRLWVLWNMWNRNTHAHYFWFRPPSSVCRRFCLLRTVSSLAQAVAAVTCCHNMNEAHEWEKHICSSISQPVSYSQSHKKQGAVSALEVSFVHFLSLLQLLSQVDWLVGACLRNRAGLGWGWGWGWGACDKSIMT